MLSELGAIDGEWRHYAGGPGSAKYSSLNQINAENFTRLKTAWTWRSPDEAIQRNDPRLKTWAWESTPIMADGVLYVSTSLSQVAAIDPVIGRTRWVYDPQTWKGAVPPNHGFVHRGVAYWRKGRDARILYGTSDGYLICLDARTGKVVPKFGDNGRIDLTQGLGRNVDRRMYGVTSPPIICNDVVVVGCSIWDFPMKSPMPPGDVRGFDVRTGKQRWIFHTIPREREFGAETWESESWHTGGAANAWAPMSFDPALGYLYLPISTPANDYYGAERKGDGLFGECLLCLNARTGKRVWHFQTAHHGLWDYDPPCAPNLVDICVQGKTVRAVAQVTKQGFCFVLDRVTGKPIWPIEEKQVPQSSVSGEKSSKTQPFPSKPAPFDRQGISESDLINYTPKLRQKAQAVLSKYNYGPLFTPPSLEKLTINMPGVAGGASWAGAAFDPQTGMLYVPSVSLPFAVRMLPTDLPHARYFALYEPIETIQGIPIFGGPYGRMTAIDLTTGEHRWMVPMGKNPMLENHPLLKPLNLPPSGRQARGHTLVTSTLLIVGQEGYTQRAGNLPQAFAIEADFGILDPVLRAYDKANGAIVGEVALPRNATGAPMTYKVGGQQYIVVPTGGANLPAELIALRLP